VPSHFSRMHMRCHALPYAVAVFLKMAGILMVYFAPDAQPMTSSVSSPPVEPSDSLATTLQDYSSKLQPGAMKLCVLFLYNTSCWSRGTTAQRLLHVAAPHAGCWHSKWS